MKKNYEWMSLQITRAAWFSALAAFVVAATYPVNIGVIRIVIAVSVFALWVLTIILTRHIRWFSGCILALGLLGGIILAFLGHAIDPSALQSNYVKALTRYEGTRYVWGGENRWGIDCSGLVRRALADAYVIVGIKTGNPLAFRSAIDIWWHDFSAKALRDQYQGRTRRISSERSINTITNSTLLPGDMAVTSDGIHVLTHLADSKWIEADPGIMRVVKVTTPTDNIWFTVPVIIVRWTCLDKDSNNRIQASSHLRAPSPEP